MASRMAKAVRKAPWAFAALFLFILALQLLKEAAGGLGPLLRGTLDVTDILSALGFGWVLAYVVLSGSPVAAIALTFFATDAITDVQAFAMITGSRFGAAFIVLLIGFVYQLRGEDRATSLQIGILSLIVTYTIYLPALPLGYVLLQSGVLDPLQFGAPGAVVDLIDLVYEPLVTRLAAILPELALFVVGVGTLLVAFNLFDRALPDVSAESPVRELEAHLFRPIVMFLVGLGLTAVTMSVSVSLGLLVPLSAKGLARRENVIPYILGANVSTFIDTLLAALLLNSPRAFTIVLAEMMTVALLSLLVILLVYEDYERLILGSVERILRHRHGVTLFMLVTVAIPVTLLIL